MTNVCVCVCVCVCVTACMVYIILIGSKRAESCTVLHNAILIVASLL